MLTVGYGGRHAFHCNRRVPQNSIVQRSWRRRFAGRRGKMSVHPSDVGSAVTSSDGSLVWAKLWLHVWYQSLGQVGTKEATEARWELKRSHATGSFRTGVFEDPYQEINRRSEDGLQQG